MVVNVERFVFQNKAKFRITTTFGCKSRVFIMSQGTPQQDSSNQSDNSLSLDSTNAINSLKTSEQEKSEEQDLSAKFKEPAGFEQAETSLVNSIKQVPGFKGSIVGTRAFWHEIFLAKCKVK